MNTIIGSFRDGPERYSSARYSLSTTPKMGYNGIHNYDTLRLKMTLDGFTGSNSKRLYSATKSTTVKRYSTPAVYAQPPPSPLKKNQTAANRYSTLQYYAPEDYTYSFFPSRHKYIKGKKRPIAVKVHQFAEEQNMSKKLQQELKIREQKKRLENDQKFQKIKERYLELSKNRKSAISSVYKPKTAQPKSTKPKITKNQGIIISPWDDQQEIELF